nr:DUF6471 domain-containing protein [Roseovarius sp. BRH_c41]
MNRNGVTYAELVERLLVIGINDEELSVADELSQGKFSGAFLL